MLFCNSFNKHLLNTNNVPGTGDVAVNKEEEKKSPYILSPDVLIGGGGDRQKYMKANISQGVLDAKRKLNRVRGARGRDEAPRLRYRGPRGSYHYGDH